MGLQKQEIKSRELSPAESGAADMAEISVVVGSRSAPKLEAGTRRKVDAQCG